MAAAAADGGHGDDRRRRRLDRAVADGTLTVGPQSAGADPGPACYGRGGTAATVTDAHVVLGHLPASCSAGA